MPSYDYQCQENEHIYTETRSITEEQKVTECPECGAELKRIFEAGGSLRDVQDLAGHRSIATTQLYIARNSEAQRKVVDLL